MIYSSCLFTPCFLWCHILNSKWRTSIQNMNAPIDSFRLKAFWNVTHCQKASHHIENCVIFPLANSILLRCVSFCKLPVNPIHFTKIFKFLWNVLFNKINAQYFCWVANFFLNKWFINFKCCKCLKFLLQNLLLCDQITYFNLQRTHVKFH